MSFDDCRPTLGPAGLGALVDDDDGVETKETGVSEALKRLGPELMVRLFSTSKTIRLYDLNNRATQRSLADLLEIITSLLKHEKRAAIQIVNDLLILNDYRIPLDARHYGPFEYMAEEMKKREVEGFEFMPGVTAEELGVFVKLFYEIEPGEGAFTRLQERLAAQSLATITVMMWVEHDLKLEETSRELSDVREESNRVYFRTVALMGDILSTIEKKHILHVKKAKRLTQQMVDIIQTDESLLVGLASIKNFDAYTFAHSVNVCILSMVVGDRMRMEKSDVARLGISGLFHDIGKTYIPSTILNSSGSLAPQEWELMKYHTVFGVKELSRTNSLREAIDPMFVSLQHHIHYNMNGYPRRPDGWDLRMFSRIITVADYYDAMTAYRSYQKDPVTPDKALRFILENSGEVFDPFVSKIFIRTMGLYPIGTVVELDTGEKAVVVRQNKDVRNIHRPQVEIVDDVEAPASKRRAVDLTERSTGEYRYKRSVVRTIHDSEHQIDKRPHFIT